MRRLLISLLLASWWEDSAQELQPVIVSSGSSGSGYPRCEEITIPMCRGIGYNLTNMPNEMNHDTQEEAGFEVHQFWPLVEINCSAELKFFLCSMYTPICFEDYPTPLKVCRSVCERARTGCAPLMQHYGFEWPDRMNCDKLPVQAPGKICMEPPEGSITTFGKAPKRPPMSLPPMLPPPTFKCRPGQRNCRDFSGGGNDLFPPFPTGTGSLPGKECRCKCKAPLVPITRDSLLYNRSVSVAGVKNCAYPCKGVFYSEDEKKFADSWVSLWAGLCGAATFMTLTTFLIDTERFKYPERPIVFMSACYFLVSAGYLVRTFVGNEEVACENDMVTYNASGPKPCTLVFLMIYFFGMASSIWWVILTFTWFLAAGFKWSNEAIASYSQYFHLAAWLIPTVKSVGVLIMSAVDGDPIAGICYVGNQNPDNLRKFVIIPLVSYLIIGISFLFAGFVALFRIRNVIRKQQGALGGGGGGKTSKLEKLMIRIGIYSFLYTLPAGILIACYLYEASYHNDWMSPLVCPCGGADSDPRFAPTVNRPLFSILMVKYFMILAVGITSGVWIWSGKTIGSWKRLWQRLFGGAGGVGGGKPHKQPVLINDCNSKARVMKHQYLLPPSIPVPPVPCNPLLPGPHIAAHSGNLGHYPAAAHAAAAAAGSFHHHMMKQQSQMLAPLSHV